MKFRRLFITVTTILLFSLFSQHTLATKTPTMLVSCNVSSHSFQDIPDSVFMKEVTLTGSQMSTEGKKLLGSIGQYEFWVETNLMSLFGNPQIMDFLVKIIDKKSGMTYQAVSGRHPVNDSIMSGKLQFILYERDGITEKGSLGLDCLTHDIPSKPNLETIQPK